MRISSEGMGIMLRILGEDDLPDVAEAANDRSIHEGAPLVPYPYTYLNAAELLEGARKGLLDGSAYHMCVRTIGGGFVGMCALYEIKRDDRNAQIGYWIRSSMRGRGYGRSAVALVSSFGFTELGLDRIYAKVLRRNYRSIRLLEKIGFRIEGELRASTPVDGELLDSRIYGLSAKGFDAVRFRMDER